MSYFMNKSKLYLIACGGHGRVLLDTLLALKIKVDGIVDTGLDASTVVDIPLVGDDEWLFQQDSKSIILANGLGIVKNSLKARQTLFEKFNNKGFYFISIQHPSSIVSRSVTIYPGAQIMAGATVQCGVFIGPNAVLNTSCSIDHECYIAEHAFIGPNSTLCGHVRVEKSAFIGAGSIILPGINIGEGAVVGAGSVVTKNVLPDTCVYGNPAT